TQSRGCVVRRMPCCPQCFESRSPVVGMDQLPSSAADELVHRVAPQLEEVARCVSDVAGGIVHGHDVRRDGGLLRAAGCWMRAAPDLPIAHPVRAEPDDQSARRKRYEGPVDDVVAGRSCTVGLRRVSAVARPAPASGRGHPGIHATGTRTRHLRRRTVACPMTKCDCGDERERDERKDAEPGHGESKNASAIFPWSSAPVREKDNGRIDLSNAGESRSSSARRFPREPQPCPVAVPSYTFLRRRQEKAMNTKQTQPAVAPYDDARTVGHYIGGKPVEGVGARSPVYNPATGAVARHVVLATSSDV